MALAGAFNALKSSTLVSWKSTGKVQKTIASCIERTGKALHSGEVTTVKIWPEIAGVGRYFDFHTNIIPASIHFAAEETPLSTTLSKDGYRVRTVEHLLSALEATGVDNCRIQILNSSDSRDCSVEVPIFDGSAREWVEAIQEVGLQAATKHGGDGSKKLAPFLNEPVHVWKNDSFIAAFPSPQVYVTYGINFPQVPSIGCQWFSLASFDDYFYTKQIASSRTFCIYEEVERMRDAGLIKGGSVENAIICSTSRGWLNPPLRFLDEPCRHKILDLIGDLSLFARCGSQGLPVAHIVAYKGGHALHADFVRRLSGIKLKEEYCK